MDRGWTWLSQQDRYYFRWEEFRAVNRGFKLGNLSFESLFTDKIPADSSESDFTEVYACSERSSKNRRLMITDNGYIGWAPDNMYGPSVDQVRKGDLIAIILGCSTPIIIRPHGDVFQVLGEAYIQGLMDGEAMQFLEIGQCQAQMFKFC